MPYFDHQTKRLLGSLIKRVSDDGCFSERTAISNLHGRALMIPGKRHKAASISFVVLLVVCCAVGGQAQNGVEAGRSDVTVSRVSPTDPLTASLPTRGIDQPRDYKIGKDDLLTINVWHEPDLSRTVAVRPDGKITVPLVGDLQAVGKTAAQLQEELRNGLEKYVKDPAVTVMIAEIRSQRINVVGQVGHPGVFPLTESMGVVDALAQAGGLREFAKANHIYVLRPSGGGQSVRLDLHYNDVLRGRKNAKDILLQAHDTVVVP